MDERCVNRKRKVFYFLLSGAAFFVLTWPYSKFLTVTSVTQIRPANALPPVFGLVFGVWGALGTAVANLIAGLLSGDSPALCVATFVAQFLYGYIPYKLWYAAPFRRHTEIAAPRMDAARNVIRYILIILLDCFLMLGLMSFVFQEFNVYDFLSSSSCMIFLNNYVFSMVLGVPVLIFITIHPNVAVTPKIRRETVKPYPGVLFDIFLILSLLAVVANAIVSKLEYRGGILHLSLAAFGFALVFLLKPVDGKLKKPAHASQTMSLNEKLILAFLLISVMFAVMIGAVAFVEGMPRVEPLMHKWRRVYTYVAIEVSMFYIVALVVLRREEKRVVIPIADLASMAEHYVDAERNIINSESFMAQCAKYSNGKTETGRLARSLVDMAGDIGQYVQNITRVTAEKERIGAELGVAAQIQANMLPRVFPPFPERREFDLYARMCPAKEVGGDFYDFFLLDENHLAIIVADVSGKGVPAALFMVITKTLIKSHLQHGDTPEETITKVNDELCEGNDAMMFVTAWLGVLDIQTGEFTYVNAGHNPPLYRRTGADYEWLNCEPGLMLAVMPGMEYAQKKLTLSKNDRIFVYTDGVPEAIDREEEPYGNDRLYRYMNRTGGMSPIDTVHGLLEDVRAFVGLTEQFDDITMLLLEYTPQ